MEINREKNPIQQNDEWIDERLARFTASNIHKLICVKPWTDTAMTYILERVSESLTGIPATDEFTSKYTDWGNEYEPIAKGIYEAVNDVKVIDTGFIPFGDHSGGSPDGLIGKEGILEVKCPFTLTSHLRHLRLKTPGDLKKSKKEYYWQCIDMLLVTNRKWIDFMSYHPKFTPKHQVKILRIYKYDVKEDIQLLNERIDLAVDEKNKILETL